MNSNAILILILFLVKGSQAPPCLCDKLVLASIFQVGTCGRAARCNWELMHFKAKLLGDNSMDAIYEAKIKEMLCRIPTYAARKYASDTQDPYKVCNAATISQFYHFPMPTQYYADKDRTHYFERMEKCVEEERKCNDALWIEIDTLCKGITTSDVTALKTNSKLTMRNNKTYEFSVGSCKIRTLRRKSVRKSGADETAEPIYEDDYEPPNHKYPKLMSPYFELYLLYSLDPLKKLTGIPIPDRCDDWKAYMELANYLPQLMIHHMDTAIQCIYNRVNSDALKWDPAKFCKSISTFVCLDLAKLKGTNCIALGFDPHDITKKP